MSNTPNGEVYGSRTLYTAVVAGAALLLAASVSSFGTSATPDQGAKTIARTPTTVETVVVTPGQST